MKGPLKAGSVFILVAGSALAGMLLGGLFGFVAGLISPTRYSSISFPGKTSSRSAAPWSSARSAA